MAAVLVVAGIVAGSGQPVTSAQAREAYTPSLRPDGQPDIQGIYISPHGMRIER